MTFNCTHCRAHLEGYLDGTLPPDAHAAFEAHLASCDSCRKELEEERKLRTMLASLGKTPAPPVVRPGVMARIRDKDMKPAAAPFLGPSGLRLASQVAVLLVCLMVGVTLFLQHDLLRIKLPGTEIGDLEAEPVPEAPAEEVFLPGEAEETPLPSEMMPTATPMPATPTFPLPAVTPTPATWTPFPRATYFIPTPVITRTPQQFTPRATQRIPGASRTSTPPPYFSTRTPVPPGIAWPSATQTPAYSTKATRTPTGAEIRPTIGMRPTEIESPLYTRTDFRKDDYRNVEDMEIDELLTSYLISKYKVEWASGGADASVTKSTKPASKSTPAFEADVLVPRQNLSRFINALKKICAAKRFYISYRTYKVSDEKDKYKVAIKFYAR